MLIVNWLAPTSSISKATGFSLVERSWETWLWPGLEKGPLCAPAKTQLLLNPNWATSPVISTTLLVSALQMPSFNPEQKLLSGLIYNTDLLTGPKAFLPSRAASGLKLPPQAPGLSLHLCPLPQARRWHLSLGAGGVASLKFPDPAAQLGGPTGKEDTPAPPRGQRC